MVFVILSSVVCYCSRNMFLYVVLHVCGGVCKCVWRCVSVFVNVYGDVSVCLYVKMCVLECVHCWELGVIVQWCRWHAVKGMGVLVYLAMQTMCRMPSNFNYVYTIPEASHLCCLCLWMCR